MGYFNDLTESQEERLHLLIEEASEVIHMATKTLRFGYQSTHNDYHGVPNINLLTSEIGDLLAAVDIMLGNGDVDEATLDVAIDSKKKRCQQFLKFPHII